MLGAFLLGLGMLAQGICTDVIVAKDGSGNYTTIADAVGDAPDRSNKRYVIYVMTGVYKEHVEIPKSKWNISIVGDGMDRTIITDDRSNLTGRRTFDSATFVVEGDGFIARDLSFENTAGPRMHQAVALRISADRSVVFRCGIHGHQDTLYAHKGIQFYRECIISGTVDFIFGEATAVFQKCNILARKPLQDQKNTVTANGRKKIDSSGFSIQFSNISVDHELQASLNTTSTYLGRPWQMYSRTVVIKSFISSAVRPEGWLEMDGDKFLGSLFYAEYKNYGPGADVRNRVKWPGYQILNDSSAAEMFSVSMFIKGDSWLPATQVPYIGGL